MTQEVIVYIIIGLAVLAVAIRGYRIFTHKHKCCEKEGDECHCDSCPLANEGCKMMKNENNCQMARAN